MTAGLLDTSVLIAADASAIELAAVAAISVITVGELHAGVLLAQQDEIRSLRQQRLDAVRTAFAPLPVDEPVAKARREGDRSLDRRDRRRDEPHSLHP